MAPPLLSRWHDREPGRHRPTRTFRTTTCSSRAAPEPRFARSPPTPRRAATSARRPHACATCSVWQLARPRRRHASRERVEDLHDRRDLALDVGHRLRRRPGLGVRNLGVRDGRQLDEQRIAPWEHILLSLPEEPSRTRWPRARPLPEQRMLVTCAMATHAGPAIGAAACGKAPMNPFGEWTYTVRSGRTERRNSISATVSTCWFELPPSRLRSIPLTLRRLYRA